MNKRPVSILSSMLVLSLILSACDISITINPTAEPVSVNSPLPAPTEKPKSANTLEPSATDTIPPTEEQIHDIYTGFTDNSDISFLIIHRRGEKLGVTQDNFSSDITGVTWTSPEGESIVVYENASGFPDTAVVGDIIIRYTNYTNTTVDITIIHPDGKRDYFRTTYSAELHDRIASRFNPKFVPVSYSLSKTNRPQQQDYLDIADAALFDLDVATCVISSLGAATLGIPGLLIMANACAGPLIELKIREGKAANMDVGTLEEIKAIADSIGCAGTFVGNITGVKDCLSLIVTELIEERDEANVQVANIPPAPFVPEPTKPCKKSKYTNCP